MRHFHNSRYVHLSADIPAKHVKMDAICVAHLGRQNILQKAAAFRKKNLQNVAAISLKNYRLLRIVAEFYVLALKV